MNSLRETSPNWHLALRRYILASGALHFVWEIAQLPLYTIWTEPIGRKAFAVLHCTVGDLMIAGISLLLTLAVIGKADWPRSGSNGSTSMCAAAGRTHR